MKNEDFQDVKYLKNTNVNYILLPKKKCYFLEFEISAVEGYRSCHIFFRRERKCWGEVRGYGPSGRSKLQNINLGSANPGSNSGSSGDSG